MEKEWLDTLSTINPEEVTYTDYVESGQALAKELRGKGCQFIIALTHMRTPNDIRLAENTTEIDLILGGHDHVYEKKEVYLLTQRIFCKTTGKIIFFLSKNIGTYVRVRINRGYLCCFSSLQYNFLLQNIFNLTSELHFLTAMIICDV